MLLVLFLLSLRAPRLLTGALPFSDGIPPQLFLLALSGFRLRSRLGPFFPGRDVPLAMQTTLNQTLRNDKHTLSEIPEFYDDSCHLLIKRLEMPHA